LGRSATEDKEFMDLRCRVIRRFSVSTSP
jgi:hypothetical protein